MVFYVVSLTRDDPHNSEGVVLMDRRRRVLTAVLLGFVLVAGACGSEEEATPTATTAAVAAPPEEAFGTLEVGLLNPLTGIFALLGGDTNLGFEMYLDENDGVLAGWEIATTIEDDAGDPTVGTTKVRKLVEQDDVDVLIGGVSSGVAYGIGDYVAESGVPYLITIAGADGLTQGDAVENIYRISYTGSQPMHALGEYACSVLGYKTATVVSLDFSFGWETAGGFSRVYEAEGCDVVQEIYVPLGTEDYAPFIQQISRDTDVVMHVNSGPASNLFWQTYRDFGYEQPVVGHGAIVDEALLATDDSSAIGAQTVLYWSRATDSDLGQAFVETYEAKHGKLASQGAEAGYSAAMVLESALQIAGSQAADPEVLNAAFAEVEVTTPRGPIRFDEYGQAVMNFYIRETQAVDDDPSVNKQNTIIHTYPEVSQFWTTSHTDYLTYDLYTELKGSWASN